VLGFGWPGRRFEEGQFGAQETDALRAGLQPGRHLGGGGSVAEQRDDPAVAGDRRKPPCRDSLLAQLPATVHFTLGTEKLARARVDDNGSVVSLDDHRFAAAEREQIFTETNRHRHAESARHDRRMGGSGSLGKSDAENQALFEAKVGHVCRPEIARDQDRRRGRRGHRGPDERAHGADAQLANVGGAGGQQRIRNRGQQVGMTYGCLPQGIRGADFGSKPFDLQSEGRILDHQLVRLENFGLVLETGATEAFRASRELGRHGVESGDWVARACRGGLFVVPDEGAANRDPA